MERKSVSKNNSYTHDQIKIIEHLIQGISAVEISKKTGIPQYTISKQLKQWKAQGLIIQARRDPLCNKAKIYNVDQKLRKVVEPSYIESRNKSLFEIHKLRFKAKYTEKNGEIATDISRFAHAQFKFIKTYSPHKNDIKYIFEKTGIYGRYKIICHRNSLEVVQVDKPTIEGKDIHEKESKLSIELAAAANRFIEEQRWCGCYIKLGELNRVGKYDIATKSGYAQAIVDSGINTHKLEGDTYIDNSDNKGEFEGNNPITMTEFDEGLKGAREIVKNGTVNKINYMYGSFPELNGNIAALCQSGLPLQNQFNQMTTIISNQSKTMSELQETVVSVVKSMEKVLLLIVEKK